VRVSREQATKNRDLIVDTASRLFRERGFDGIGVADLMKGAGLTHGGFYGHFESKDDLAAEACGRALAKAAAKWEASLGDGGEGLADIVEKYLSERHRDSPGSGCLVAALGADVARRDAPVRRSFTEGLMMLVDALTRHVTGSSKAAKRRRALATFAEMVGAVILSRAVNDRKLSKEILDATKSDLLSRAN
jgi:TetR/AcrR family transcriptional regulator, transcriptional repressor for nem operon